MSWKSQVDAFCEAELPIPASVLAALERELDSADPERAQEARELLAEYKHRGGDECEFAYAAAYTLDHPIEAPIIVPRGTGEIDLGEVKVTSKAPWMIGGLLILALAILKLRAG